MSGPVIHLDGHFLQKAHIEPLDLGDYEGDISMGFEFDYEVFKRTNDPSRQLLILKISSCPVEGKAYAYNIDFHIIGLFSFDKSVDEQRTAYLLRVNGCTILYGLLRGMITMMTGPFPEASITLPTVMMEDIVKTIEIKKRQQRESIKAEAKRKGVKKAAAKKTAKKKTAPKRKRAAKK